jgi:hypothetical protein
MKTQASRMLLGAMVASLMLAPVCTQADVGDGDGDSSERIWSFDRDAVGSVPQGWEVAETAGRGTPATWEVMADTTAPSSPNVTAIAQVGNSGQTYNLLITGATSYEDLAIEVLVKAIAGEVDQGGGPIWRARDADNYYIARWNPLEDNFRVYRVKEGRRKQLGSARAEADPAAWHQIEIEHEGNRIKASFDGEELIALEDSTFLGAGMVGLWTKADAATAFDDFEVEAVDPEDVGEHHQREGHEGENHEHEGDDDE